MSAILARVLCVFALTSAGPALAQPAPPAPAVPHPVVKTYAAKHAPAAELASCLTQLFQGSPGFRALAAPGNVLMVSAPTAVLEQAMAALDTLDRRPLEVAVEVVFAEAAPPAPGGSPEAAPVLDPQGLAGAADAVLARLDALRQQGKLVSLRRVRVNAVEGQQSSVQSGEERSVVVASAMNPRGGVTSSVDRRRLGTLVEALPRVSPEGKVLLTLRVEDSRLTPGEGGAESPAVMTTDAVKSTLTVTPGRVAVVSASGEDAKGRRQQAAVLVAVHVADAGAK